MKKDTTKVSSSAFAMTFTSANKEDYPILYSEDQWHLAKKGGDICKLYDAVNLTETESTGAQFTQKEVNETLAKAINDNTTSKWQISEINSKLNELSDSIVGVYHYCGTVNSKDDLPQNASHGDVYNTSSDGMNYAYVCVPEKIHQIGNTVLTGKALYSVWDSVFNGGRQHKVRLMVNGEIDDYMIGATSGCKIYAFKTSGSGSGSGVVSNDFVDLSSYEEKRGLYTKTSNSVVYYQLTIGWDSLGRTEINLLWEDE